MKNVLQIDSIKKSFPKTGNVLNGINLQIKKSEVLGLLGPNGSGKSTLLKIIVNLLNPDNGTVLFWGTKYSELELPVNKVGCMLSPEWVDKRLTVEQFIASQVFLMNATPNTRNAVCRRLIADVGLHGSEQKRVCDLSLGMRQRLCLACCFLSEPDVLILDEPLNGLDVDGVIWLQNLIRLYRDRGCTIILSSHLMAEMQTVVDRVAVLNKGKIVALGSIASLSGKSRCLISTEDDVNELESVFRRQGYDDVIRQGDMLSLGGIRPAEASSLAFSNGFSVSRLCEEEKTLEEVYRGAIHSGDSCQK